MTLNNIRRKHFKKQFNISLGVLTFQKQNSKTLLMRVEKYHIVYFFKLGYTWTQFVAKFENMDFIGISGHNRFSTTFLRLLRDKRIEINSWAFRLTCLFVVSKIGDLWILIFYLYFCFRRTVYHIADNYGRVRCWI